MHRTSGGSIVGHQRTVTEGIRALPDIQVLTPEYPPSAGGVADYTGAMARALARQGVRVTVWCPGPAAEWDDESVHVRSVPKLFSPSALRAVAGALRATSNSILLVQYVPSALGYRGLNLAFPLWLRSRRRDMPVQVMFHEPYFYFGWQRPWRNVLAIVQRIMAAISLDAASVAWASTPAWIPLLNGLRIDPDHAGARWLPVPSTISVAASSSKPSASGAGVIGHFGTYGEHSSRVLRPAIAAILERSPEVRIRLIGRGGDAFIARNRELAVHGDRLTATGEVSSSDVSIEIQGCNVMLQPYLDGVTTRRTSIMAALAHGRPVVTNRGPLTESLWEHCGCIALTADASASNLAGAALSLVRDESRCTTMGNVALEFYEATFSIERAVETFLTSLDQPVHRGRRTNP